MGSNEGARRLDETLRERGVTREQAERQLCASKGTLSRILHGERSPGRALSIRIRDLFGVAPELWDQAAAKTGTEG